MTADPTPPAGATQPGPRILVAAGGTGGHVFPGLALARTLKELEPTAEVHFAGTSRGIESRAVPAAGFPLHLLPILPLSRRPALETVLAPFAAVGGAVAAWRLVRRHHIEAVAGMGGYVTLPVAVGARLAGVPVVLHEQNAIPGIANRLAARLARRIALGVAAAAASFPAGRTVTIGNPVRPELARLDRNRVREVGQKELGLDRDRATLFVFGGSQGARHLNQAVIAATPHWPRPERVQILHACGRRDEAEVREGWRAAAPERRGLGVRIEPFVERMDLAYAACDLALTRAGAMTMAELTAAAVPAIMVPLPYAAADHQAANARAVAAAGGAVVVRDEDLDGERLAATAAPLLEDPERLARMSVAMASLAYPAAAQELAALVLEATGRGTRETFLAATPAGVDREGTGWFEAVRAPLGPQVSRRVDRRSKRLEAYPPIEQRREAGTPPPVDLEQPLERPPSSADGGKGGRPDGDPGGVR
ncbi:MAG TPA: undecaprenyldiphospho-muramoylpentapeptide beta-N-acetylglucosaminyltransferase [Actinomycetota bacterium]|nr:undecaprenyldiphospho-muramoylpentapeptide beta-N-acetylglucosaminyltransferase [Actinomycetota bacterium]